jgi:hypothetical protein
MTTVGTTDHKASVGRLSTLDRLLPVWIGLAMAVGLLAGRLMPGLGSMLNAVQIEGISLPIALGLLAMMYPVLAKVRYDHLDTVTRDRRLLVLTGTELGDRTGADVRLGVAAAARPTRIPHWADYCRARSVHRHSDHLE